jgi:hypothetical protein
MELDFQNLSQAKELSNHFISFNDKILYNSLTLSKSGCHRPGQGV